MMAGHMLGGALWRITKGAEDVIYAVDFNHAVEKHLDSTILGTGESLVRPTVLICDARNAQATAPKKKDRNKELGGIVPV
jgi:cleavage and polyadenylation specificity factor subunit 2